MVTLLARFFVKNREDYKDHNVRAAYGILCGVVGIVFNVILFAGKLLAGILSSNIAITADAFNNLSDAGSSIITMIGFKLGNQKPDPEHPFGHGRLEYISALAVSVLIILMGYELLKSSFAKVINPVLPECSVLIIVILIVSIAVKGYMALYNFSYGKKIESPAMFATAKDSLSDVISTAVVLISAVLGEIFDVPLDGYFGLFVALLIVKTGIDSIKETIGPLLGEPPAEEFVDSIEQIVMSHSIVLGMHDLVVHDYGPGRVFISLHAEVPFDMDILEIHDEIDIIESELKFTLNCDAVIHMDPIVNDEETLELKEKVGRTLKKIDEEIKFHDFRVVKGPTHTNLIFDVLIPFDFSIEDSELKKIIFEKIQEINPSYFTVVTVDHEFAKSSK